jgi:DNA-binding CsgD family transcriptional regulator
MGRTQEGALLQINFANHYAWKAAGLTARQAEQIELIAQGYTDPEIAEIMGNAPSTVKFRTGQLCEKLGIKRNRVVIARWWWEHVERPYNQTAQTA